MRTGVANLPLHYGQAPSWLFENMTKLAREISLIIIKEYGTERLLTNLSDPFWFQSFGCVLGFDWHSSGVTTTTCAALKEGLKPIQKELGFFVCGGKGKTSRKTPQEIENAIQRNSSLCPQFERLVYASRLAAKVDNNALQDGFQLYHHNFFFTISGKWAVVQQGMNGQNHWARRYHWLSDNLTSFVCEPHSAICSQSKSENTLNLIARESEKARLTTSHLAKQKPKKIVKSLKKIKLSLHLSPHHEVLLRDINPKNLEKIFLSTYENQPQDFEKLLALKGVGPKTIRALSLISELIYHAPASTRDPARFSFAHGGKDGHPYPVDKETYTRSIEYLKEAVNKTKLGYYEKLHALRRLGGSQRL
jgi:hypothetical protein